MGPLVGKRIIEIAGLGPGPVCGMMLADMGAEVTLIDRRAATSSSVLELANAAIMNRPAPLWEVDAGEIESLLSVNLLLLSQWKKS